MSRPSSFHHRIPKSRGGRRGAYIPDNFHRAWHLIFGNLYGLETAQFVTELDALLKTRERNGKGGKISSTEITALRKKCRSR